MFVFVDVCFFFMVLDFTISFSSENLPEFNINMIILWSDKSLKEN